MAYYETAYPSLTSGVSQQLIQDRLPGQLSAQTNMMSDLVRGLCRRPPVSFVKRFPNVSPATPEDCYWRLANVSGKDLLTRLDINNNTFTVFDPETGVQYPCTPTAGALAYIDPIVSPTDWRSTTLGSDAFFWSSKGVVTTGISPSVSTYQDPSKGGYFYIATGAFNTKFEVTVRNLTGGVDYTANYLTPNGAGAGDAALSTPSAIAAALKTAMDGLLTGAGLVYTSAISGAYVYYKMSAVAISVTPLTNPLYLRASGKQSIKLSSDLPAQLPTLAADFIMQVGDENAAVYYRWDTARAAWLEDAGYGQQEIISNICLKLSGTTALYTLDVLNSEQRAAGNSTTNPRLNFVTHGITGLASFKGRLVLLSGQYVNMSAVNNPARWYRSTLTGIVDSDPIEVAASVEFSSDYKSAVEFNKNLLVTSERNQALMPGDVALTPRTASLSVVSNYNVASDIPPKTIGRSVMLPFNRASGYLGIAEALPPDSIESPLVSTDVTAHIPTYIAGRPRFMSSSSNADVVVVGAGTGTPYNSQFKNLYIHQFLWAGTDKVKSAWHTWTFAHAIEYCYFIQDTLYMVFSQEATPQTFLGKINLGRGDIPPHFLDYATLQTVNGALNVLPPSDYLTDLPGVALFKATGVNAGRGEVAPYTYPAGVATITPADAVVGETYYIGFPFESSFVPTPPIFKDRNDNVLSNEHIPLRCFKAQLYESGLITARVLDRAYDSGDFEVPIVGIYQPALIGSGLLKATGMAVIPARTEGSETELTLRTSDYYDMNVTTLEYGFRLSLKHRRA